MCDAKIFQISEGANQIQRMVIPRNIHERFFNPERALATYISLLRAPPGELPQAEGAGQHWQGVTARIRY